MPNTDLKATPVGNETVTINKEDIMAKANTKPEAPKTETAPKVKDVTAPKTETAPDLIKIVVGNKRQIEGGDTVNVGINGKFYHLKCGEEVAVTRNVVVLLKEGGYAFQQVDIY